MKITIDINEEGYRDLKIAEKRLIAISDAWHDLEVFTIQYIIREYEKKLELGRSHEKDLL